MGGSMKSAHGHMHGSNNSRRKWSNVYVVMAIVCCVFGCGILGIMGIHRLREKRSHNLLIKEKDDQILSLHLLLQKERERVVEAKRKAEEMKTKIASLGSQKVELSSKVSEMQSTISSLREEQRAVESAFQEKQSEANLMREKYAADLPRVEALREELRQREGEIEGLKLRLQLRSAEVRPNATMPEAKAAESSTMTTTTASSENEEAEPKSMKEHEHEKAADDEASPRRFRGKYGYLRRSKGRRWISKQTQGKRTYPSDRGASTMADNALRNSSSATKMDGDGVQKEQTGEETSITKPAEEKNENQQHTAERNGEAQDGDVEESEETNEPEF